MVPVVSGVAQIDPDYLYRAAKYVEKTFRLFDKKTGVAISKESALDVLGQQLQSLQIDAL